MSLIWGFQVGVTKVRKDRELMHPHSLSMVLIIIIMGEHNTMNPISSSQENEGERNRNSNKRSTFLNSSAYINK